MRAEEEPAARDGAHRNHGEDGEREARRRPRDDDDDDDDDDDVDLSAYQLGDEDEPKEDVAHASAQPSSMSREEMLLMREAQEGGFGKSRKTFFVDDSAGSIEKSAGKERRDDLKKTRILAKQVMGGSGPPGSGSDRMGPRR